MNKFVLVIAISSLLIGGCAKIDPFSPRLRQDLQNQNGKIEELKNNQNGLMLEMGKIRNQNEMNARDIKDAQQGLVNLKGMQNSGIQFFSGDGGLIVFLGVVAMALLFIYHYRQRAVKSEKAAEIMAQQITLRGDPELENNVLLSALNTEVEADVYHMLGKAKH